MPSWRPIKICPPVFKRLTPERAPQRSRQARWEKPGQLTGYSAFSKGRRLPKLSPFEAPPPLPPPPSLLCQISSLEVASRALAAGGFQRGKKIFFSTLLRAPRRPKKSAPSEGRHPLRQLRAKARKRQRLGLFPTSFQREPAASRSPPHARAPPFRQNPLHAAEGSW